MSHAAVRAPLITSMTAGPETERECDRQRLYSLNLAQSVLENQRKLEAVVENHRRLAKKSKRYRKAGL